MMNESYLKQNDTHSSSAFSIPLFFTLTKKPIAKGLIICTLIFSGVLIILMAALAISKNNYNEFLGAKALILVPVFSLAFSLFIMILAFFTEYYEFAMFRGVFARPPFDQIATRNFRRIKLFDKSMWKLHKEVYVSNINGFLVVADLQSKKTVAFTILTSESANIAFDQPHGYREILITSNKAGVELNVPVDSFSTPGIDVLYDLISRIASWLSKNGSTPDLSLKKYEGQIISQLINKSLGG